MPLQSDQYKQAKDYLEKLKFLKKRESYKLFRIESITNSIGEIKRVNKSLPIQLSDLKEYQKDLLSQQNKLAKELRETRAEYESIIQAIENLPDQLCRSVLEQHYVEGEKWEDVAAEMGYSIRQLFRIRDKALLMIKLPE